jgi:hypothetical protein
MSVLGLDSGKVDDGIANGEIVVAGDAKDFGYSDVLEPRKNVVYDSCWYCFYSRC